MVFAVYNNNQSSKRSSPSTSYTPSTSASANSYDRAPSPEPKPAQIQSEPEFTFELPPIGQGRILSMAQIRWCLRENIRMDAKEPLIASNSDVAVFNQSVNSYNSRCANYRYRRGNLERAKRQLEKLRFQIVEDAKREFKPIALPVRSAPTPRAKSAETVREVQVLLKGLGYNPGPIDGQYGNKTSYAIKNFQRGLLKFQDGLINQEVLSDLRKEKDKALKNIQSFSVKKSQFYVILTDKQGKPQAFETNRVPFDTGHSCYGWRIQLTGISGSINLKEILTLPTKPAGWPKVDDGSRKITVAPDGKSAATERTVLIKDGWVNNVWCVGVGDPIGPYSTDVIINNKFIKTFNFEVVEASG